MKIVHAIRSDGWAGVERHVAGLAVAQRGLGHDVAVIGGDPERMRTALGPAIPHVAASEMRHVVAALSRRSMAADVLNTHMTAADVAAVLAARRRSGLVVSTRHFAAPRGASPVWRLGVRALARRLGGQIAVSRYVAEHIDGASTVVLSGVAPVDGRATAAERVPVVLAAQRLEGEKGGDEVVRAFAASGLASTGWSLHVAGDGSQRLQLGDLAARLGVGDRVRFLGHRDDIGDLMCRAAIFIAPGRREAFGLAVVEAMARGLPVVAAGAGAYLETVGSVAGAALFRPDDPAGAGRLLADLADDPDRRDRYGQDLQDTQRLLFTVEQQALRTDAAYQGFL